MSALRLAIVICALIAMTLNLIVAWTNWATDRRYAWTRIMLALALFTLAVIQ